MKSDEVTKPHPMQAPPKSAATGTQTARVTTMRAAPGGDGRLSQAFESAPIGMAIFDEDGRLRQVNQSLCQALDCDSQELLAQPVTAVVHQGIPLIDKQLVEKLFSGELPSYRGERRTLTKQGDPVWLDLTAVVVRGPGDEALYGLAMIENITHRKRSAEALRQSEERYRSFVANSSEGIWRFEIEQPIDISLPAEEQIALFYQHGYLAECNDAMARMYGHSCADEILGARFGDFLLASNPTSLATMRKFMANGYQLQNLDKIEVDKSGAQKRFVTNVVGVVINGRLLRLWGTQRDETQRKEAEDEVRDSRQRMRSLAARIQALREQERSDIAREMHDVLGQSLTSVRLDLSWLQKQVLNSTIQSENPEITERLMAATHEVEKTIAEVKTLSTELRPGVLDKFGLAAAIEWQCQEFERRTGIKCDCQITSEELSLTSERSTALFRILQEALVNVARHSQASSVCVTLGVDNAQVHLTVADNGKGITAEQISNPASLGLLGMRERAELLDGYFNIEALATRGTKITASIPFAPAVLSIVEDTAK